MNNGNGNRLALWIMVGTGIVIIVLLAVFAEELTDPHGLLRGYHCRAIWEVWELGAILWSMIFAIYYVVDYSMDGSQGFDKAVLCILLLASAIIPGAAIYFLIGRYRPLIPVALAVALNLIYFGLDLVLATYHSSEDKRRAYRESFFLADAPIVVSNLVFFVWLLYHLHMPEWIAFASGLVAFQLLSCNCIFVITQAGLIRTAWDRDRAARGAQVRAAAPIGA